MKNFFLVLFGIGILISLILYQTHNTEKKDLVFKTELSEQKRIHMENMLLRITELDASDIDMATNLISLKDTTSLKDIIKDKTLVYKFSSYDCNDCIRKQMELLKRMNDAHNNVNIIVLYEIENIPSFKNFAKKLSEKIPIWGVKKFQIKDHAYFILDPDGRSSNFFIPQTDNSEQVAKYLSIIRTKYFN